MCVKGEYLAEHIWVSIFHCLQHTSMTSIPGYLHACLRGYRFFSRHTKRSKTSSNYEENDTNAKNVFKNTFFLLRLKRKWINDSVRQFFSDKLTHKYNYQKSKIDTISVPPTHTQKHTHTCIGRGRFSVCANMSAIM